MRLANCFTSIVLASSLALVACGGGDDAGDDDGQTIDPNGTHTQYVADTLIVPSSATEASSVAFDVDGNGRPENALGGLLAALASTAGLDLKTSVQENVDNGTVIILADIQATDLTAATGVGMSVYLGADPDPAPCTDPADPATCGQHLSGSASFGIDPNSPTDATLVGQIVGGQYQGGPGTVGLELPLAEGTDPVALTLIGAQIEVDVTATTLASGKLGGAITDDDIRTEILPAVVALVADLVSADCTGTYPDCCADPESTGAQVLSFFNTEESADCVVTQEELESNSIISSTLLNPDLDLLDADGNYAPNSDGVKDSLSLGIGFTGVGATFTAP